MGMKVVYNPAMPATEPGVYACGYCGGETDTIYNYGIFNHRTNSCETCQSNYPGCKGCQFGVGAVCTYCEDKHYRMPNGTCLDCRRYDSDCSECDGSKCRGCRHGYWMVRDNCVLNPVTGIF